jgi:hypothetical protein
MITCKKCKQTKPESEFWRRRRDSPALSPWCKKCDMSASRESRLRHLVARRNTEREYHRRRRAAGFRPTLTEAQKKANTHRLADYYNNHLDRYLAKLAVRDSVMRGEGIIQDVTRLQHNRAPFLLKSPYCPLCGRKTPIPHLHGHHYEGYAADKRLTVLFICRDCHGAVTAYERDAILQGLPPIAGLAVFIKRQRVGDKSSSCQTDSPDHGA